MVVLIIIKLVFTIHEKIQVAGFEKKQVIFVLSFCCKIYIKTFSILTTFKWTTYWH